MPTGRAILEPGVSAHADRSGIFDFAPDPPPRRTKSLRRPAVEALRRANRDRKVVLISAAAGYGKSTALSNWCASDSGRPVVWAALDPSHNASRALLVRLMSGLNALSPLDDAAVAVIDRRTPFVDAEMLQTLTRCMAERTPFLLAFDDVHEVTAADSVAVIRHVIDTLPAGSQMVLATRSDPDVRIARLRAAGDLLEIRADALTMDRATTTEYLQLLGVPATKRKIATLHEATEGWPAGIALACLAGGPNGQSRIPAHLSGNHHQIAAYFVEEVLGSLDDDSRSFLLRTSVVRRFSADLVNAMLERSDGHDVIDRLAASNCFIIPLDDEHRWFRYHHLFQDLLIARLDRSETSAQRGLLRRAARWHADHGTIDEALDYAQRSGDVRLAGELMLGSWERLVTRGQMATLLEWIGRSTDDAIASDPSYSIIAGWIHTLTGDWRRAEFFAAAAARHPLDAPAADGAASLASALANLRSALGTAGIHQMLVDGQFVYDSEHPGRSRWMMGGCRALGAAHLTLGNLDSALAALDEGVRFAGGGNATAHAEALCDGLLAFVHLDRHEFDRAETRVGAARELIERNGLEATLEALAPIAAEAIVAGRRGDSVRARLLMSAVVDRLTLAEVAPWYKATIAIRLGELALDLDESPRAQQLSATAGDSLLRLPDAGTLPIRLDALSRRIEQQSGGYSMLTPAERRVLVQLATHRTLAEIGKSLYVSRTTIKSHVSSIYSKLGVTTRNDAVSHLPMIDGESGHT